MLYVNHVINEQFYKDHYFIQPGHFPITSESPQLKS